MSASTQQTSLSRDVRMYLQHQLRGRRGLLAAAVVLAGGALWLGWPALVAAGIAPLLIAFAPCALMCGLGLCMGHACKKSDGNSHATAAVAPALRDEAVVNETPSALGPGAARHHRGPVGAETPTVQG